MPIAMPESTQVSTPFVNFVLLAASDNLRQLETEFAENIVGRLPGYRHGYTMGKKAAGAVNVTFWIYRPAHVMMSHGVADKNYLLRRRKGEREINKFARILVPGDWLKRKTLAAEGVELDETRVDVVGWPRLDSLLQAQATRAQLPPREERRLKVLWAPTHSGVAGTSSFPHLEAHEPLLQSLFDFEASIHPNDRQGGRPTFEALLDCDVVITDQGTMLYEAWALGKGVVCPHWLVADGIEAAYPGSAEAHIYAHRIGSHAEGIDDLVDRVRAATAPDAQVRAFLDDYLDPSSIGCSYDRIAASVRRQWELNAAAAKLPSPKAPRA